MILRRVAARGDRPLVRLIRPPHRRRATTTRIAEQSIGSIICSPSFSRGPRRQINHTQRTGHRPAPQGCRPFSRWPLAPHQSRISSQLCSSGDTATIWRADATPSRDSSPACSSDVLSQVDHRRTFSSASTSTACCSQSRAQRLDWAMWRRVWVFSCLQRRPSSRFLALTKDLQRSSGSGRPKSLCPRRWQSEAQASSARGRTNRSSLPAARVVIWSENTSGKRCAAVF